MKDIVHSVQNNNNNNNNNNKREKHKMIKYAYLKTDTGGVVTAAMLRPGKNDPDQTHHVGFAFCSPKDSFQKALGRKIAEGALNAQRGRYVSYTPADPQRPFEEAFELASGATTWSAPTWLKKAFKRGSVSFGLRQQHKG